MTTLARAARDRLEQIMLDERLSAKEVERRTGVADTTIGRILSGKMVPSLDLYDKLMTGLGYDVRLTVE
jgi:transcriptional regulator with XRE-family HTH domain